MTRSRKRLPALALLAAAWPGAAWAQPVCGVDSPGGAVRAEGITEKAAAIIVRCSAGGVPARDNFKVTVELPRGVPITNAVADDDRTAASIVLRMYASDDGAPVNLRDTSSPPDGTPDEPEIFGKLTADDTVEFTFDRPAAGNADARLRLEIRGIRVNAAAAGGNAVEARVRAGDLFLSYDDAVIAEPETGLTVRRTGDAALGLTCARSEAVGSPALDDNENANVAAVEIAEGFAGAFEAGETQIMLTFRNVPAGVSAWLRPGDRDGDGGVADEARNTIDCAAGGTGSLTLQLLTGVGGRAAAPANAADNYARVDLRGGSGSAVYKVTAAVAGVVERCRIPIAYTWDVGADVGAGTVRADFAPTSAAMTAAVEAAAEVPRFVETSGAALATIVVERCSTTLLFPFVTNRTGFSTGIVIANTSQDAFGTAPQEGSCTIYYYGGTGGGGAPPSAQTSRSVPAGGQLIFTLSAGAAEHGIAPTPEFHGYIVAHCGFEYAHGAVLISNGIGGAPSLMHGYTPLVVPRKPGQARAGTEEALGQ